jgi:hypothetical protein
MFHDEISNDIFPRDDRYVFGDSGQGQDWRIDTATGLAIGYIIPPPGACGSWRHSVLQLSDGGTKLFYVCAPRYDLAMELDYEPEGYYRGDNPVGTP